MKVLPRRRLLLRNRFQLKPLDSPANKSWIERWLPYVDITLKFASIIAFVVAGLWAYRQYAVAGSDDWMVNLDIQTEVLPYKDDLRLLVIHVKATNPRSASIDFEKSKKDSFKLSIRKLPVGLQAGEAVDVDNGEAINEFDFLPSEDVFSVLPGAEQDSNATIVLPVNAVVSLSAVISKYNADYCVKNSLVQVKP
ncbi:hypothetical protein FHW67_003255 [Herbaspirillum sp. Sphag1AN]|uniref:hypothetical protein n=1 Tax=unclassified Herbaspirillum TaxID=2624150 RepID=UPI00161AFB49|nr:MULTISPECIES: hypothetical protein [unclassified Herbaspirillum]MBB3213949.1 hypothetical protein [Herbaspirillum sp. Sphag1AN]MBB3247146.1 hypothetical protein [Herbaspirillum sp. Sphag64]